ARSACLYGQLCESIRRRTRNHNAFGGAETCTTRNVNKVSSAHDNGRAGNGCHVTTAAIRHVGVLPEGSLCQTGQGDANYSERQKQKQTKPFQHDLLLLRLSKELEITSSDVATGSPHHCGHNSPAECLCA